MYPRGINRKDFLFPYGEKLKTSADFVNDFAKIRARFCRRNAQKEKSEGVRDFSPALRTRFLLIPKKNFSSPARFSAGFSAAFVSFARFELRAYSHLNIYSPHN